VRVLPLRCQGVVQEHHHRALANEEARIKTFSLDMFSIDCSQQQTICGDLAGPADATTKILRAVTLLL
jgi:hypothetical protein